MWPPLAIAGATSEHFSAKLFMVRASALPDQASALVARWLGSAVSSRCLAAHSCRQSPPGGWRMTLHHVSSKSLLKH